MSEEINSPSLDAISDVIEQFLASPPYFASLLLVHTQISKLNAAVDWIAEKYGWPVVSVGGFLAKPLLKVGPRRRPSHVSRIFAEVISEFETGALVCKDIDLLLEPGLRLDPLRLLLETSRQTALIVAWPGTYEGHTLAYAVPDHGHYRFWAKPDLCDYCIVTL